MVWWHHWLNGLELNKLGDSERQGCLACCSPWVHKEFDMAKQLNNCKNINNIKFGMDVFPLYLFGVGMDIHYMLSSSPWLKTDKCEASLCRGTIKSLNLLKVKVTQSFPTLCEAMDCSLPGSSVHEILQARNCSRYPFPSPGDLPNPGTELWSPTL